MFAFRSASFAAVALVATGCLTPRSAGFGMPARALGAGVAEMSLAMGGAFQTSSTVPQDNGLGGVFSNGTGGTQVPSFEANAQLGLTDTLGLNLHASSAGLQPGVKLSVLTSPFELSILPEAAAGMTSSTATITTTTNNVTTVTEGAVDNTYDLLAGLKILLSFPFGLYGGVGYDYEYLYRLQRANPASPVAINVSRANNLCAAVGFELKAGPFSIRPEVAAVYTALAKNHSEDGNGNRTGLPDSTALHVFPNVVIAVASKP